MKLFLRIIPLVLLLSGTFSQDFDLADAFDDPPARTPAKPKADKPKDEGDFGFDLSEALKPDSDSDKKPDVNPPKSGGEDPGLDLLDALGPDLKPDKPSGDKPRPGGGGGGGGSLSDSDLFDVAGGGGGDGGDSNYKPDGGGHRDPKYDSGYDSHGGADQPQGQAPLWPQAPQWLQVLRSLGVNVDHLLNNVKQSVAPLLRRLLDLLDALPGN